MSDTIVLKNNQPISVGGKEVAFPDNFTLQSLQDQINTCILSVKSGQVIGAISGAIESEGLGAISGAIEGGDLAQLTFLTVNFIWGGAGDLQRPYGAAAVIQAKNNFVNDYTVAASYLYGVVSDICGLSLSQALFAAAALNQLSTSKKDNTGILGLPQGNQDAIQQAFNDVQSGFLSPDSSTPINTSLNILALDFANLPGVVLGIQQKLSSLSGSLIPAPNPAAVQTAANLFSATDQLHYDVNQPNQGITVPISSNQPYFLQTAQSTAPIKIDDDAQLVIDFAGGNTFDLTKLDNAVVFANNDKFSIADKLEIGLKGVKEGSQQRS